MSTTCVSDVYTCHTCGRLLDYAVENGEEGEALDQEMICTPCARAYFVDMKTGEVKGLWGEVERLRVDVQRLTAQAASERARNLRLEEGDDHASILSDLGDLLDQRDTWREGEGTVDQVRRICSERDALRSQVERLTAERAALLAPVEGVDLEEVLRWVAVRADVLAVPRHAWTCGQRCDSEDLAERLADVVPALAREVERLRAAVRFADEQGAEAIERVSSAIVADKWSATAAFQERALKAEAEVAHLRALARLELPDPVPGGPRVRDRLNGLPAPVRVAVEARLDLGLQRYGAHLSAGDGRGPVDALQEAADLWLYLHREALSYDMEAAFLRDDLQGLLERVIEWTLTRVPPSAPAPEPA